MSIAVAHAGSADARRGGAHRDGGRHSDGAPPLPVSTVV